MRFAIAFSALFAVLLLSSPGTLAQTVEVSRQNRTVEVVVTETVRVEPDIADVTIGCISYGETHEQAYQANLGIADKVIKALLVQGTNRKPLSGIRRKQFRGKSGKKSDS